MRDILDLNIFDIFKRKIEKDNIVEDFIDHLDEALQETNDLQENRKEGHLYLVTEDRKGTVYLWDFTEKAETEFEEKNLPEELIEVAKEGAMLQYKDGKYELYSPNGYDMLEEEEEKNTEETGENLDE